MLVASKALVVTEATAAEVARDLEEVALSVGSAMVVAAEKSSRRLAEVTGGWVHTWEAAHSSLLTYTSTSAASALLLRPKRSCARPQRWVRPA